MRAVASTQIRQHRPAEIGQAENLVQLAIGQEPSVRRDFAAVEFQLQSVVEVDTQRNPFRFTHRVRHDRALNIGTRY